MKYYHLVGEYDRVVEVGADDYILPNFKAKELACPTTGVIRLHPTVYYHLYKLRNILWRRPIAFNSACRSNEHNGLIGGHPRSLHLIKNPVHPTNGCMAFDINVSVMTPKQVNKLRNIVTRAGWSVGEGYNVESVPLNQLGKEETYIKIVRGFMHIDRRVDIGLPRTDFYY